MKKIQKTMLSISALFLLVFSIMPFGVMGQETEPSERPMQAGINAEEMQAFAEAIQAAKAQEQYARAYFMITERILSAEAVIEYLNENYAEIDTSSIASYLSDLESIRDSLNTETDFKVLREEVKALIDGQKEAMGESLIANNVDKEVLKDAVAAYKEASSEDEAAKDAWNEARSDLVYAQAERILTQLNTFGEKAEAALGEENEKLQEYNDLIAQINVVIDELAAAVQTDDKETVKEIRAELKDLILQTKEVAKELREKIKEQRQSERDQDAASIIRGCPLVGRAVVDAGYEVAEQVTE